MSFTQRKYDKSTNSRSTRNAITASCEFLYTRQATHTISDKMRAVCLAIATIAIIATLDVKASSLKCTMMPFEAKDGRTGKCCVIWDEAEKPTAGVATSAPVYLPPSISETPSTSGSSMSSTSAATLSKTDLRKKVIDTPRGCRDGQVIDVNGDCVDPFD